MKMFTIIVNAVNDSDNKLGTCISLLKKILGMVEDIVVIGDKPNVEQYDSPVKYISAGENMKIGMLLNDLLQDCGNSTYICYIKADVLLMPGCLEKVAAAFQQYEEIGLLMPSANTSREPFWCTDMQADTLEQLFVKTAAINNAAELKLVNVLRIDDYCIIFRRNVLSKEIAFNEQFHSELYVWQDFALKVQLDGKRNVLLKSAFVCKLSSDSLDSADKDDEYIFSGQWRYEYKKLLGTNNAVLYQLKCNSLSDKNVLHIGCKAGSLLADVQLQNEEIKMFGLESDQELYNIAKILGNVQLYDLAAAKLPYAAESFDCVIIDGFMENGADVISMIQKARRVLKSDGFLIITALNIQSNTYLRQIIYDEIDFNNTVEYNRLAERYFSHNQICHLIKSAGLDIINITGQLGNIDNDFISNIKNMDKPAVKERFLSMERFTIKAYQTKRDIQFCLRKLEYNFDCQESSLYIAEQLKSKQCSAKQVIFYICQGIIYKDMAVYNLLKIWYLEGETVLIELFCSAYMEQNELDKQMLADILELIIK